MTTNETAVITLPVQDGDYCVEVVGNEARFWLASQTEKGGIKVRQIAVSYKMPRFNRILQNIDGRTMTEAADLTNTRLYPRDRGDSGFQLVRKYFPEAKRVHFFYNGHGPSGHLWCFTKTGHFSFSV